MSSFGSINEFDASNESWTLYSERLQQFFIANGIEDGDRRRAIFLTVVGPTTYALLRNLLLPEAPSTKSIDDLIRVLNAHFDPTPSEIVERYKFNSRLRRAGESVANFIAELRSLAKYCNYGPSLDEMLRDRIVCGIQDEAIQRKLLSENPLSLTRATEIAVTMETAARDANDLRMTAGAEVNKIQMEKGQNKFQRRLNPRNLKQNTENSSAVKCNRCGEAHLSSQCRFKSATCHSCSKIGHIAKVCRSKKKSPNTGVHKLQEPKNTVPEAYTLYNIREMGEALPTAQVEVLVQGKPVTFEVDSGAPFSLMPVKLFNSLKKYVPPLEPSTIKLNSYTEHPIEVMGMTHAKVSYNSICCNLPLLVVRQGNVNLAGRNWIYPLQLMEVFRNSRHAYAINNVPSPNLDIQNLLNGFKSLFSPDLGIVKDVKVHLVKKEMATQKFFKARPIPYALRDKVDLEITRLVQEGILEPVKTAELAAPIVPVLKRDGRIRICGDFKLTTNKVTELEQYPLPNIEDIFAQLSGGCIFSKLDLRDAYCQLQLDEESKDLVVINTHKGLFRYTVVPFGVASAPAVFQREMDNILQRAQGSLLSG